MFPSGELDGPAILARVNDEAAAKVKSVKR